MKRKFVRGLTLATGGSLAVAAVGLVRNVLIARVMGPGAFGLWQVCVVALRFAPESHLGTLHAQSLDVPAARAASRHDAALATERTAQGTALVHASALGVVAAVGLRLLGGPALGGAAVLLGVAAVAWQWFHADAVLHRSRSGFGRLAVLQAVFAASHVVALLLLLPTYYVSGALAAWILGVVAAMAAARLVSAESVPWPRLPDPGAWGALVRRGLAAYLVDLGLVALLHVDRLVVGALLGARALGHYGVLAVGGAAVLLVPDVLSRVLWPFAGERYGQAGGRGAALGPIAARTVRGLAPVLAATVVGAAQAMEVLVATVLPAFEPSLDALRFYLPAMYFLSLCAPLRILLVTAGAGRRVLRLQGGVMLAAATAQAGAAWAGAPPPGWGLEAVAAVLCAAAHVLLLLLLVEAGRTLAMAPRVRRLALETAAALVAAVALDGLLARWAPAAGSVAGAAVRLGVPAVVAAVLVWLLLRHARSEGDGSPAATAGNV